MDRADSDRTDWFPAILRVKVDPVDRAPAEDAAGREEDKAALAGPAVEAEVLSELLAECLEAEGVVELAAVGAED
jgi:hypothetical protein